MHASRGVDVVTYLGEYTRVRLARAIGDLTHLERLAPGVDTDAFHPEVLVPSNRVALAVPCHRAIRGDGDTGGYRWGEERKRRILELESRTQ